MPTTSHYEDGWNWFDSFGITSKAARTRSFFSLSGHVSFPCRTQLNGRKYKRLAMLAAILPHVFVDVDWVGAEHLGRYKNGTGKNENEESLNWWNLEHVNIALSCGVDHPSCCLHYSRTKRRR